MASQLSVAQTEGRSKVRNVDVMVKKKPTLKKAILAQPEVEERITEEAIAAEALATEQTQAISEEQAVEQKEEDSKNKSTTASKAKTKKTSDAAQPSLSLDEGFKKLEAEVKATQNKLVIRDEGADEFGDGKRSHKKDLRRKLDDMGPASKRHKIEKRAGFV